MSEAEPSAELVHEGLTLIAAVARKVARRLGGRVPVDDLKSIGHLALVDIMKTWDPGRARFAPYANARLTWAMLDGVRRETHGRHAAARATALMAAERLAEGYALAAADAPADPPPTSAEQDKAALDDLLRGRAAALAGGLLLADPDAQVSETPEDRYAKVEAVHVARERIASMPERERELFERYFFGGEPLEVVARDLGITKGWASRLNHRALVAMRRAMGAPTLAPDGDDPAASEHR